MTCKILKFAVLALSLLYVANANAGNSRAVSTSNSPVTLQDSVRLDGKIIYLGDLFINAGDKSKIAIAYTPAPGNRSVFDARWLNRVARVHKLKWRPMSRFDRVVVERSSTVISRAQIAEEILTVMIDQGADPDMEIEFSNRMLRLHVAGDALAVVGVEDSALDPRSNRFSAIIHAPAGDPAAKRIRVTGRLHHTQEVPVPARRILSNEIIRKDDLKWIKIRSKRMRGDIIVNNLDLIGKSPRRGLQAGQPVRSSSVRRPVLVKKGSLVTITIIAPKMTLTSRGVAVSNDSDGDTIQVKNSRSKTIIEAEVVGAGRVSVRPPAQLAMN